MKTKYSLNPKELKLVQYVYQELNNTTIATKLEMSLRMTEKLKARVYKKTNTASGIGLYKWALLNSLIKLKGFKPAGKPAVKKASLKAKKATC